RQKRCVRSKLPVHSAVGENCVKVGPAREIVCGSRFHGRESTPLVERSHASSFLPLIQFHCRSAFPEAEYSPAIQSPLSPLPWGSVPPGMHSFHRSGSHSSVRSPAPQPRSRKPSFPKEQTTDC